MDAESVAVLKEILEQQKRTNDLLERQGGLLLALVETLADEQDMEASEPATYMDGSRVG